MDEAGIAVTCAQGRARAASGRKPDAWSFGDYLRALVSEQNEVSSVPYVHDFCRAVSQLESFVRCPCAGTKEPGFKRRTRFPRRHRKPLRQIPASVPRSHPASLAAMSCLDECVSFCAAQRTTVDRVLSCVRNGTSASYTCACSSPTASASSTTSDFGVAWWGWLLIGFAACALFAVAISFWFVRRSRKQRMADEEAAKHEFHGHKSRDEELAHHHKVRSMTHPSEEPHHDECERGKAVQAVHAAECICRPNQ
ncbi:hypothetical protein DFJ74DRAFT_324929 [Hyaloraphidium curvatum]|nr:hypothetical protein DFJ74DRAFT_324929 [Hyaloraphidium curvatum]